MPDAPPADGASHGIDIAAALVIMARLAKAHHEETGRGIACMVAFGGTALAAHGVRRRSDDLDIYVTDLCEAAIERVTTQWRQERPQTGRAFKIDATPGNQLFGHIALHDIERSPKVATLPTPTGPMAVRALSLETMYILKVLAGRPKDIKDVRAIAGKTSSDAIVKRLNDTMGWFVDRDATANHLEKLSRCLARDYGGTRDTVLDRLAITQNTRTRIDEAAKANEIRLAHEIRALMKAHPGLIGYDRADANRMSFDLRLAGGDPHHEDFAKSHAKTMNDMACDAMRTAAPKAHLKRMQAVVAQSKKKKGIAD